jgi:hypothetical protein
LKKDKIELIFDSDSEGTEGNSETEVKEYEVTDKLHFTPRPQEYTSKIL